MGMVGARNRGRPEVVYGFLGCMAQARGESLLREVPHLDLVVGTRNFIAWRITWMRQWQPSNGGAPRSGRSDDLRFSVVDVDAEGGSQNTIREHTLKPRQATALFRSCRAATCTARTASCRALAVRNAGRPISDIVAEVRSLVERGVKEVTLLGQIVISKPSTALTDLKQLQQTG